MHMPIVQQFKMVHVLRAAEERPIGVMAGGLPWCAYACSVARASGRGQSQQGLALACRQLAAMGG